MRLKLIWVLLAFAMPLHASIAAERWQTLPPTPAPVRGLHTGHAKLNGIRLYYAEIGRGSPVVVLHGGLASSDYLGNQIRVLARHHRVIAVDSRGHGRSTRDQQPFGYDLMTDDVLALLDRLKIRKADFVGWSDGAIIGLDMAMRHPDRVGRIFAFGANTQTSGLQDGFDQNPVFAAYMKRARQEYALMSPTSDQYEAFQTQIGKMWADQPNWTDAQLGAIKSPVLVVDGDHDEGIKREHTEYIAATIPGAGLLILPNVSHFAFLQDPVLFNAALLHFLGDE
jgi:pimeloyl-ACP methyl ester carboxylesterase